MTKQEAIKILRDRQWRHNAKYPNDTSGLSEALGMAIEALSAETDDDLISRKEAIKKFIFTDDGKVIPEQDIDNFDIEIPIRTIKETIRALPAANTGKE